MNRISASFDAFLRDERGSTAIEYGLVGVLISLGLIAGATQIGGSVRGFLQLVLDAFTLAGF